MGSEARASDRDVVVMVREAMLREYSDPLCASHGLDISFS